jgi:hypothetical protein
MAISDQDAHRNGHIVAPVLNATTLRKATMDNTAKAKDFPPGLPSQY